MELTTEQKLFNHKTYAVTGIFPSKPEADFAILKLRQMGFRNSDLSISMQRLLITKPKNTLDKMKKVFGLEQSSQQETMGAFLSVHCDDSDWANRANKVLEITGAGNITLTSEY